MVKPQLQFWFDFASTYSYLSAMRIDELANGAGVEVLWKPFLLGPIFAKQGLTTSPFNVNPEKNAYMRADIARLSEERGLRFGISDNFPQNSLHAARLALVGLDQGWGKAFCRTVFLSEFDERKNIAEKEVLSECLVKVDADIDLAFAASVEPENKQRLKDETSKADRLGIFGAPTFITDAGTLFWGDDRLEQAIRYVAAGK